MAVTKQEADNARESRLEKVRASLQCFIDPALLAGHRSFDMTDLLMVTGNEVEASSMSSIIKSIYKDWDIKRVADGNGRDYYDTIYFS